MLKYTERHVQLQMEGAGLAVGHLEVGGRHAGEVASRDAASQGASPHRTRGTLDNVLRKGAKSLADFSEVRFAHHSLKSWK